MFRWGIVFGRLRPAKANGSPPPSEAQEPDTVKSSIQDRHRKLAIVADRLHRRQSGKHQAARSIGP
jgi:hypothetical protein